MSYQQKPLRVEAVQLISPIMVGTNDPNRNQAAQRVADAGDWLVVYPDENRQEFMKDKDFKARFEPMKGKTADIGLYAPGTK